MCGHPFPPPTSKTTRDSLLKQIAVVPREQNRVRVMFVSVPPQSSLVEWVVVVGCVRGVAG